MSCLSETQINLYLAAQLASEEVTACEDHLDGCAECRGLVADLVRCGRSRPAQPGEGLTQSSGQNVVLAPLRCGMLLAERYLVLEQVGAGGMGVVYAAYDRQLDRKVALKLVRDGAAAGPGELLREAQLLARVSHPNLIVVHDAGTALGQTYMAMEFVDGTTLRRWLRETRREPAQILEVFGHAAQGLYAAHQAGLVHRDFKPDNVLIGTDGRVRVTDFGLARPSAVVGAPRGGFDSQKGRIVGTPSYMAPEQYAGHAADARTDQFAFCIALYEALYGEHPFGPGRGQELSDSVRSGRVRPAPPRSRIPAHRRAALLRGLSVDPEARFPSMGALWQVLGRDRRRNGARLICGVAGAVCLGVLVATVATRIERHAALCQGATRKLAGIWDEGRKAEIKDAFSRSGHPFDQSAFESLERQLDRYASHWVTQYTQSCQATRLRGEQSQEVLDLRMLCLRDRLARMRALSDLFTHADVGTVEHAALAAAGLGSLALCEPTPVLLGKLPPPRDESTQGQVEGLRRRLAQVAALEQTGKYATGKVLAQAVYAEARALSYPPIAAEAGLQLGVLLDQTGDFDGAAGALEEALHAAEAGRHEQVALRAWLALGKVTLFGRGQTTEAERMLLHAEAYIDRCGTEQDRAELLLHRGALYRAQGHNSKSLHALQAAAAGYEGAKEGDGLGTARALGQLGTALHRSDHYAEALVAFQRAQAIAERTAGSWHPLLGSILGDLGRVQEERGFHQEAIHSFLRAREIAERALGKDHVAVAELRSRAALSQAALGEHDEAQRTLLPGLLALRRGVDERDPRLATALWAQGRIEAGQGLYPEARRSLSQAQAILEAASAPASDDLPLLRMTAGAVEEAAAAPDRGRAHYEQALRLLERQFGQTHALLVPALLRLGHLDIERAPALAVARLERALRLAGAAPVALRADLLSVLARALRSDGRDLPRARAVATEARTEVRRCGPRCKSIGASMTALLWGRRS